ncbi:MAG: hypothetical protein P1V33_11310 [Pseudohongiella nitratireducens]|nr:hypothetical protein [Pseudohongiella nitratireducens]MDF1624045.1 hypothetical protein [Pseudohongiella nitratireducens]
MHVLSAFPSISRIIASCILPVCFLAACQSQAPQTRPVETVQLEPEEQPSMANQEQARRDREDAERHRQYVADILYDGMRALREDRLTTPVEDSAFHYFNRAFALDPGNQVALDGLQDIVARYLQLTEKAARQGHFATAEQFLDRAMMVDPDAEGIDVAAQNLQLERERTHSVHRFEFAGVRTQQPAVADSLRQIASTVSEINAFVLITAPSDEMGRWMYSQVQSGMVNSRIRADIEIGEQSSVRLVVQ